MNNQISNLANTIAAAQMCYEKLGIKVESDGKLTYRGVTYDNPSHLPPQVVKAISDLLTSDENISSLIPKQQKKSTIMGIYILATTASFIVSIYLYFVQEVNSEVPSVIPLLLNFLSSQVGFLLFKVRGQLLHIGRPYKEGSHASIVFMIIEITIWTLIANKIIFGLYQSIL